MDKKLKPDQMNTGIKNDLKDNLWIDGLQRQVKLRKKALKEILGWCSLLELDDFFHWPRIQKKETADLFRYMNHVVSTSIEELDND